MRNKFTKLALAALAFTLAFTFSCSSDDKDDSSPVNTTVRKEKISGVSQKGPFVGATVKLYELNVALQKTNKVFSGTTDDNGHFEIEVNDLLASAYIILEVIGKYKNEVEDGNISDAPITLKAIADVRNKDSVNVNPLTNYEVERVIKLVAQGKPFEVAKATAQTEALNRFGIEGSSKNSEDLNLSDEELFIVSSILSIYGQSTAELADLLVEADRINTQVENSTLATSDVESLFNKAKAFIQSLYPNVDFSLTFAYLETILDKVKDGGIPYNYVAVGWPGGGCDMMLYCMESRGIRGEDYCAIVNSQTSSQLGLMYDSVTSCPKPENARYCFQEALCTMIGCFTSRTVEMCVSNGGNPNFSRVDCYSDSRVALIASCDI